ncbi:MAG: hypothetical protein V3U33_00345 [candidate division NC10 bacterium]
MTARYRCGWCDSVFSNAKTMREHVLERHRMALIDALGIIEAFGTHKEAITPPTLLKRYSETNLGVSGEGDSS